MRTPVDVKRRPLSGDISDVIEKRKQELARLKRENNNMYSLVQQRVLSKNNTPGATPVMSRTPSTQEKMRGVLEHFPSFPQSDKSHKSPKGRSPGSGAKEQLNMDVNDENANDNTAAPAMSPWRRHLQLLHEAKVAATRAQEGEARAVAALKAVEQRVEKAHEDTASKSGEITSLTSKVDDLSSKFDSLLTGLEQRMQQNDAASERGAHAKLEGEMQAKLAALEASMQEQVQGLAGEHAKLKGAVVVDVVLPPPSAVTRFCVSTLVWAGLFLLAYAYVYGGNCECMMGNIGRITN